jgi:hypothetical protein
MGSRKIARVALLATAAALWCRCTSDTTTSSADSLYVPVYYDWTVGYDPLYDPVDPFYYSDPYWTFALSAGRPSASTTCTRSATR